MNTLREVWVDIVPFVKFFLELGIFLLGFKLLGWFFDWLD